MGWGTLPLACPRSRMVLMEPQLWWWSCLGVDDVLLSGGVGGWLLPPQLWWSPRSSLAWVDELGESAMEGTSGKLAMVGKSGVSGVDV